MVTTSDRVWVKFGSNIRRMKNLKIIEILVLHSMWFRCDIPIEWMPLQIFRLHLFRSLIIHHQLDGLGIQSVEYLKYPKSVWLVQPPTNLAQFKFFSWHRWFDGFFSSMEQSFGLGSFDFDLMKNHMTCKCAFTKYMEYLLFSLNEVIEINRNRKIYHPPWMELNPSQAKINGKKHHLSWPLFFIFSLFFSIFHSFWIEIGKRNFRNSCKIKCHHEGVSTYCALKMKSILC